MLGEKLDNIRKLNPLIENITNYVTVNDCANITLACGASPIMADNIEEIEQIVAISQGVNINIGTLGSVIDSMVLAAITANKYNIPIVLDPVGAGASKLRNDTVAKLLDNAKFTLIRGNISEIKALALGASSTKGVDADVSDVVTLENVDKTIDFAKAFAKQTGSVIAISGAIDVICDAKDAYLVFNGHELMTKVTGTGCQLSSMAAAFLAANKEEPLLASVAAVATMGLCGEIAYNRMSSLDGNSSYRNYIIDAVFNLTGEALQKGARYEKR